MTRSMQQSIRIRSKASAVWAAIVDPATIERWMRGVQVESTWEPGSAITFAHTSQGHAYEDRGTVLAFEPERLLRYNHWSVLSHLPDSEAARTVVTLILTPAGDETDVEVTHDNLRGKAAFGHARFFWRNALVDIRNIVERGTSSADRRSARTNE
jgi:uncharacterized protein YndB with AHSA1/START domain